MQNTVSISRNSSNREVDHVVIKIVTEEQGIEIKLSLEEFALLITGRVLMDTQIDIKALKEKTNGSVA